MHSLIVGQTEGGKSYLAQQIASEYFNAGYGVIVLDPLFDPAWQCSFRTADPDEFLRIAKQSRRCILAIDEGSISIGRYAREMEWATTMARHWGHQTIIASQRPMQVSLTVRLQCSRICCFQVGDEDARKLAADFACPELRNAPLLGQYEYIDKVRFKPVVFARLKVA